MAIFKGLNQAFMTSRGGIWHALQCCAAIVLDPESRAVLVQRMCIGCAAKLVVYKTMPQQGTLQGSGAICQGSRGQ